MHPFDHKKEFEAGDREGSTGAGPSPPDSLGDEVEEPESEDEFADDEPEFSTSDWKQEFPDYTAQEFEEKLPKRTRASWMAPVASCLFGTFLGAAIAAGLANDQPKPRQVRAFFIYLLVIAPLLSYLWYWLFSLRPERVARKMEDEQENPFGSEPIHPK